MKMAELLPLNSVPIHFEVAESELQTRRVNRDNLGKISILFHRNITVFIRL